MTAALEHSEIAGGNQPWLRFEHSYAGWLPNVTGHLSFQLIDPSGQLPAFNQQSNTNEPRLIAVHQRDRLAQDFPLPDRIVKASRPSAKQSYLLLGRSCATVTPYFDGDKLTESDDRNGGLIGTIVVIPEQDDKALKSKRKTALNLIDKKIQKAADADESYDGPILEELNSILAKHCEGLAPLTFQFALFRTGEVRIWFSTRDIIGEGSPEKPTEHEQLLLDDLAPHAYYFMRDMFHAHYHHAPHHDQYIHLERLEATNQTNAANPHGYVDDLSWRYATLRGLIRTVVEKRQSKLPAAHQQALGVVAYARSFQTTLARIVRTPLPATSDTEIRLSIKDKTSSYSFTSRLRRAIRAYRGLEQTAACESWTGGVGKNAGVFAKSSDIMLYNFSDLEASIKAVDASVQANTNTRLQAYAVLTAVLLAAMALWIGAIQARSAICAFAAGESHCSYDVAEPLWVLSWIANHPIWFIASLVLLVAIYLMVKFRNTDAFPLVAPVILWLERLGTMTQVSVARRRRRNDKLIYWLGLFAYFAIFAGSGAIAVWAWSAATEWEIKPTVPSMIGPTSGTGSSGTETASEVKAAGGTMTGRSNMGASKGSGE